MGRKSKTQQLLETNLGQHVALAVAAHLARTQLVPDPLAGYDAQRLLEMLNRVGSALARVAPVYVLEARTAQPRELTPAELEGAAVRQGATSIVLRDGRRLGSVTMKRADLRQAIAILKSIGIQSVAAPQRPPAPSVTEAPDRLAELVARMAQLELLLRPPLLPAEVEQANRLAVTIARNSPHGRIANRAMQLMSALQEPRGSSELPGGVKLALAQLRVALEETQPRQARA